MLSQNCGISRTLGSGLDILKRAGNQRAYPVLVSGSLSLQGLFSESHADIELPTFITPVLLLSSESSSRGRMGL